MAKNSSLQKRKLGEDSEKIGRADGFRSGWEHGYWYGQCEHLISRIQPPAAVWPIHVMFVQTGKGFPYSPLDEAVAATLAAYVAQLTVVIASEPVAEMAAAVRPDIVVILDGLQFDVNQVTAMRENGIRTAIWLTDDPYYTDITANIAPLYDVVFTLEKSCLEFYRQLGCLNVHYLPFCVQPSKFRPMNPERTNRKEISFVGSAYLNRVKYFNEAATYLASRNTLISGIWWDRMDQYDLLKDHIKLDNWMGPEETAMTYNASKIVINMHRAHDDKTFNNNKLGIQAVSPNPRTFEISACAVLQLSDARDDLATFYTPDVEIVTYSSPQEMIEKLDYYLHHEEERREIAMRGMYRTLREHTYANRIHTMLSILFPMPLT